MAFVMFWIITLPPFDISIIYFRMKHSGLNETHVCNVCGKNFSHKQYLDKHLQTHENTEKNFVCKVNVL